jgi:hypothetical protein
MSNIASAKKIAKAKKLRGLGWSIRDIAKKTGLARETIQKHTRKIPRSVAMMIWHKRKNEKKLTVNQYLKLDSKRGFIRNYAKYKSLWSPYVEESLTRFIAEDCGVELTSDIPRMADLCLYDNEPICATCFRYDLLEKD